VKQHMPHDLQDESNASVRQTLVQRTEFPAFNEIINYSNERNTNLSSRVNRSDSITFARKLKSSDSKGAHPEGWNTTTNNQCNDLNDDALNSEPPPQNIPKEFQGTSKIKTQLSHDVSIDKNLLNSELTDENLNFIDDKQTPHNQQEDHHSSTSLDAAVNQTAESTHQESHCELTMKSTEMQDAEDEGDEGTLPGEKEVDMGIDQNQFDVDKSNTECTSLRESEIFLSTTAQADGNSLSGPRTESTSIGLNNEPREVISFGEDAPAFNEGKEIEIGSKPDIPTMLPQIARESTAANVDSGQIAEENAPNCLNEDHSRNSGFLYGAGRVFERAAQVFGIQSNDIETSEKSQRSEDSDSSVYSGDHARVESGIVQPMADASTTTPFNDLRVDEHSKSTIGLDERVVHDADTRIESATPKDKGLDGPSSSDLVYYDSVDKSLKKYSHDSNEPENTQGQGTNVNDDATSLSYNGSEELFAPDADLIHERDNQGFPIYEVDSIASPPRELDSTSDSSADGSRTFDDYNQHRSTFPQNEAHVGKIKEKSDTEKCDGSIYLDADELSNSSAPDGEKCDEFDSISSGINPQNQSLVFDEVKHFVTVGSEEEQSSNVSQPSVNKSSILYKNDETYTGANMDHAIDNGAQNMSDHESSRALCSDKLHLRETKNHIKTSLNRELISEVTLKNSEESLASEGEGKESGAKKSVETRILEQENKEQCSNFDSVEKAVFRDLIKTSDASESVVESMSERNVTLQDEHLQGLDTEESPFLLQIENEVANDIFAEERLHTIEKIPKRLDEIVSDQKKGGCIPNVSNSDIRYSSYLEVAGSDSKSDDIVPEQKMEASTGGNETRIEFKIDDETEDNFDSNHAIAVKTFQPSSVDRDPNPADPADPDTEVNSEFTKSRTDSHLADVKTIDAEIDHSTNREWVENRHFSNASTVFVNEKDLESPQVVESSINITVENSLDLSTLKKDQNPAGSDVDTQSRTSKASSMHSSNSIGSAYSDSDCDTKSEISSDSFDSRATSSDTDSRVQDSEHSDFETNSSKASRYTRDSFSSVDILPQDEESQNKEERFNKRDKGEEEQQENKERNEWLLADNAANSWSKSSEKTKSMYTSYFDLEANARNRDELAVSQSSYSSSSFSRNLHYQDGDDSFSKNDNDSFSDEYDVENPAGRMARTYDRKCNSTLLTGWKLWAAIILLLVLILSIVLGFLLSQGSSRAITPTPQVTPAPMYPTLAPTTTFEVRQWDQLGESFASETPKDETGFSVAMSTQGTTTVAIGARKSTTDGLVHRGKVNIFDFELGQWQEIGELKGEAVRDQFGFSVALSANGRRLAVGSVGNDTNGINSGMVQIFERRGRQWKSIKQFFGSDEGDIFGAAVSLSANGRLVAIGAPYRSINGNARSGEVYFFEDRGFETSEWVESRARLAGTGEQDYFGWSVSLAGEGDHVSIGAPISPKDGNRPGYVRIFKYTGIGDKWEQRGQDLTGDNDGDRYGFSVSMDRVGEKVAVGAYKGDGSGKAMVYKQRGSTWESIGGELLGMLDGSNFGYDVSLAMDGDFLAVGAPKEESSTGRGAVHVFSLAEGDKWLSSEPITSSDPQGNLGFSVCLDKQASRVAIGSPLTGEGKVYE